MGVIESATRAALGLGLKSQDLDIPQMGLRAAIVYVVVVLMVRLSKKRFMGRATAFDVILGIMLGSIVSRAVTGNPPFLPALVAAAVLLGMHWLFSSIAMRWHGFGSLIKGEPAMLIRNGEIDMRAMGATHITEHDLWEDLRGKGVSDLKQVAEARLERSGTVSVIEKSDRPKVVEVAVQDGVQTVRIEIAG